MGLVARGAVLGIFGIVIAVGCGGADAQGISPIAEGDDSGASPSTPSGSATSGLDPSRPDSGTGQGDDDSGTGDDSSTPKPDASTELDAGADTGTSGPTTFTMPAKLENNGTCWQDEFPNPVCKPIPTTSPPILEWDCATGMRVAELRVPPRSCLRVGGRFDGTKLKTDGCFNVDCTPAHESTCRMWSNTSFTEEDSIRVHFKRCAAGGFTAWWYPIEDCPSVPGCF